MCPSLRVDGRAHPHAAPQQPPRLAQRRHCGARLGAALAGAMGTLGPSDYAAFEVPEVLAAAAAGRPLDRRAVVVCGAIAAVDAERQRLLLVDPRRMRIHPREALHARARGAAGSPVGGGGGGGGGGGSGSGGGGSGGGGGDSADDAAPTVSESLEVLTLDIGVVFLREGATVKAYGEMAVLDGVRGAPPVWGLCVAVCAQRGSLGLARWRWGRSPPRRHRRERCRTPSASRPPPACAVTARDAPYRRLGHGL